MKLRCRMIQPQFFTSEQVVNCSFGARILFQGLWCLADREGRVQDRPSQIKLALFPVDKVNIERLFSELVSVGLIVRYEAEEQRCIWIPRFKNNQPIHPHEAKSTLPEPPEKSPAKVDVITCPDMSGHLTVAVTEAVSESEKQEGESEGEPSAGVNGNGKPQPTEILAPEDLVQAWNEIVVPLGLPAVEKLSGSRRQKVLIRLKEYPDIAFWNRVFSNIRGSPFLRGLAKPKREGEKPFRVRFDWLFENDNNAVKVYEGQYSG